MFSTMGLVKSCFKCSVLAKISCALLLAFFVGESLAKPVEPSAGTIYILLGTSTGGGGRQL